MPSDAATSVEGIARSVMLLSALVATAGAAIVVGPGYLNPLRFGPYFIAVGTACFFIPGLLGLVGGQFMRRERIRWPWVMSVGAIVTQLIVAAVGFGAQFFFTPLSPVPLIFCAVWAIADVVLLTRLLRVSGALRSDTAGVHGFAIETTSPRSAQIESVREK